MKRNVLCVAAVLALAGAAQADLVTNGGFETGNFAGWSQFGNTGFTGVTGGGVEHSGTYGAFFGPIGSVGGITQTLTLAANTNVTVSFWLHNDGGNPNSFDVTFDGVSLMSLGNDPGIGYGFYSFNVTTTNANPSLTFSFQQDPAFWYLDDASVVVPLPTGVTMGLAGLAGVGVLGRIRRRK
jgi:hypothetical protein